MLTYKIFSYLFCWQSLTFAVVFHRKDKHFFPCRGRETWCQNEKTRVKVCTTAPCPSRRKTGDPAGNVCCHSSKWAVHIRSLAGGLERTGCGWDPGQRPCEVHRLSASMSLWGSQVVGRLEEADTWEVRMSPGMWDICSKCDLFLLSISSWRRLFRNRRTWAFPEAGVQGEFQDSRAGLLRPGSVALWGQIVLCGGSCPMN